MLLSRSVFVVVFLFAVSSVASADLDADFETISQRLIDQAMARGSNPSNATIAGYLSALGADGRWSDVNYDNTSSGDWLPREALNRLDRMGRMYNSPTSGYYRNETLKAKYLLALDYWFTRNPTSSNSWWNKIGGQQMVMDSMLIMKPYMDATLLNDSVAYLYRGDIYDPEYGSSGGSANNVNLLDITIHRGIMADSSTTMQTCFGLMGATFMPSPTNQNGLKVDGSFHAHDRILYNGGYGKEFLQPAARYAVLPDGTSFAFLNEQKESLARHMLAQQWMMRGSMDYSTQGRSVTRTGQQAPGSSFASPLTNILSLNTSHQYELQRMLDRISTGPTATNYLRGNAAFYRSDFITHHRQGWYASVHMVSTRTRGSESGNGEGLKNYHMGDGVNFITRGTFDEYRDIFPVWNWRRLPGTTVEQKTGALPLINWGSGSGGSSDFVGEVSDGHYGMSTMTYSRDNVSAKKSWFFFDDEQVALGADIQAPSATYPVYTSLNQSLINGLVVVKDAGGERILFRGNTSNLNNAQWIFHDQTGYVFLDNPGQVTVRNASQSGSWSSINSSGSSSTITKNVFSAWVDHGPKTANGQYAYIVVPGIAGTSALDSYAADLPISVLRNDASIQAVRHNGRKITQAVFRHTIPLVVRPDLVVISDQKVMVMLQERSFGMQASVANPAGDPSSAATLTTNLYVTRELVGDDCSYTPASGVSRLQFQLPALAYAGQTVTKTFDYPIPGPKASAYRPTSSTAALYNLDDSPGSINITDQSGNGMDLMGSASNFDDDLGPAGLRAAAAFTPGAGKAALLPRRVLSSAEVEAFNTNHFTVEAWIKNPDTAQAGEGIFELGKSGSGKIQFGLEGDKLSLKAEGLNFADLISSDNLTWLRDTWYHVAVTVDTGSVSDSADAAVVNFYQTPESDVDGLAKLVGALSGTGDLSPFASANNSLMLGVWDNSDSKMFSGLMDQVRFTNEALSADQFALVVPEPASFSLMAMAALAMLRRRRWSRLSRASGPSSTSGWRK